MNQGINRLAKQLAQRIERDLYLNATVDAAVLQKGRRRTGRPHYHQSFLSWVEPAQAGWRVVLMNTAPHASIIEGGSRPHVIKPRNASVLRFEGRDGVVFAHVVHHPGTKAYRILGGALDTVMARQYLHAR